MDHSTGSFLARGGVTIFTQTWRPAQDPRARVVLVHGFGEHSGRYTHVAEALVAAGYLVTSYDHRGHGRSGGPRGRVDKVGWLTANLALFRSELAREPDGGLPTVLVGHSMGAAVVLDHLVRAHEPVAAAVVSGAYLRNAAEVSPVLKAIAPVLGRLLPGLPTEALDPATVSRDVAVTTAYAEDPLVFHSRIPAVTAANLLGIGDRLLSQASSITEPMLIAHGTEDLLADVEGSRELARLMGDTATLITYDGLHHEIFNEPEGKDVLADVVEWLDNQLR